MIGLSILVVFLLVTALTLWIFISVIKRAKRKGKNPYLHGGIATIILFFLITWDWIPSEIYYAYQCKQLHPMQVYKTPEQWVAENQDLIKREHVEFKIKSEKDIPQISKEGYKLHLPIIGKEDTLFAYAYYKEEQQFLRTHHTKKILFDRRTGLPLISETLFHQVVRFYSPPLISGGKHCGFQNKNINELNFLRTNQIKDFYQLQRDVNKGALK